MHQPSEIELKSSNLCRDTLSRSLQRCRTGTLKLFEGMSYDTFCRQAHPDFSPVGWHLGHIALTESLWILERCAGNPPLFPQYRRLFAADGLPKGERISLPPLSEVCCYLETVREQVFKYLEVAPLDQQERLWRWLLQHESQHGETIAFVLQLQRLGISDQWSINRFQWSKNNVTPDNRQLREMVKIPAGEFELGNESKDALDNERPVHQVYLDSYWIDRYPVTCGQYQEFIAAGGYQNSHWWSSAGWKWLQENPVNQPLYWSAEDNHPVCGVSWYEADAYARFAGKRLPTEAEWEKAASWDASAGCRRTYPWGEAEPTAQYCNHDNTAGQTTAVDHYPDGQSPYGCFDMLGNVWEWTDSWFDGYEGFTSFPYTGYSQVYFDGEHRVLRGSSWATRPWAMRCSFRNWYHPGVRQIFAGFRCARND